MPLGFFFKGDLMLCSQDPKANERAVSEWLRTGISRPGWPGYDRIGNPLGLPGLPADNRVPWNGYFEDDGTYRTT